MKTLYKAANRIAGALGMRRLESWSYMRWLRWWMRRDPVMGYWRFASEYLGKGDPGEVPGDGAA